MNALTRFRSAGAVLLGGGLATALLLLTLVPGIHLPWSPPTAEVPTEGICNVHYYALDSGKESTNAFGPRVVQADESGIKAELAERRLCGADKLGDPALTAAHYAEWSTTGLTSRMVGFDQIDAFEAELIGNFTLWEATVKEMTDLESASAFSIEAVPAGHWSLYMVPDGAGGVTTHQGFTGSNGTNIVFTHPSGAVVKFRLDCGFQPNRPQGTGFPGVPVVPPGNPEEPTCPPGWGVWPDCLEPKVPELDPSQNGSAPDGGVTNQDPGPGAYVPPGDMEQPPVNPYVPPTPPVAVPVEVPVTPPSGPVIVDDNQDHGPSDPPGPDW